MNTYTLKTLLATCTLCTLLTGCNSESEPQTKALAKNSMLQPTTTSMNTLDMYKPDEQLLLSKAQASSQLYVEPEFKFNTANQVTLDLSATNVFGESLANSTINVYAIDNSITSLDDQGLKNKQLLAKTRLNSAGQLTQTLDVPAVTQKILIRVDGMLETNQLIVTLEPGVPITHAFR